MFGRKLGYPKEKRVWALRLYNRFFQKYHAHDLNYELQTGARHESADYVRQSMTSALIYQNRWAMLEAALSEAQRGGLILEFGVEKGASTNFLARLLRERGDSMIVHAFDSFEGLPGEWSGTFERKGKFSQKGKPPKVLRNVRLHKGWFKETIPAFLTNNDRKISLIHIDCDLYSSTKTILDGVGDLLQPGSIIVFDEYFNYHNWREHEFKAWQEFVAAKKLSYVYRGFTARGGQVYLKVL